MLVSKIALSVLALLDVASPVRTMLVPAVRESRVLRRFVAGADVFSRQSDGTTIAQQYRIVYKSPRPTYDGTRRNIVVNVGGGSGAPDSTGGGAYVEQHLVNFKSNILIAIVLLLPLLVAVVIEETCTARCEYRP